MNILFLGDSITDCGHSFTGDNLGNGYVKKLSLLPGVSATNGGTDGFTFPDVLRKWRLMYARNRYDCVVMTCGINDVGVAADLKDAGRNADASAFLGESMAALRTLLCELTGTVCAQTPSAYGQIPNIPALAPGTTSPVSRILLLEPFLFPIPRARELWLPALLEVRKRIQKAITDFHGAHIAIPGASADSDMEVQAKQSALTDEKISLAAAVPCIRYIPTQAALDGLSGQIGLSAVTTDGVHLTDKGHECLAKLVADALGII